MSFMECVSVPASAGDPLGRYVEFVAARCRPNTVIATVSDLRVFFGVIDRAPTEVTSTDVFAFIAAQRRGPDDGRVVRLAHGAVPARIIRGMTNTRKRERLRNQRASLRFAARTGFVAQGTAPRDHNVYLKRRIRTETPSRRAAGGGSL